MSRTVHHTNKNSDLTIPELTNTSVVAGVLVTTPIQVPINQILVSSGNRSVQDEFGTYRLLAG